MDIYRKGMDSNHLPIVTTDPNKLEEQAKSYMTLRSFNFVSGGAGEKSTMVANRLAFRQWKVRKVCILVKLRISDSSLS
jgi:lactate 2-monooxygenase